MDDRFAEPQAASPVHAQADDGTGIINPSIDTGSPTAMTALNDDAPGHDDPHSAHDIDALIARIREANDPKTITQINALLDHRNHLEPSPVGVTTVSGKPHKTSSFRRDHTLQGSPDDDYYTVPLHSVRASLSPMRQETAGTSASDTYTGLLHRFSVGMCFQNGIIHVRKRVPADVQSVVGKRELWRSLGTRDPKIAIRRSHRAMAAMEAVFEQARVSLGRPVDGAILRPPLLANVADRPSSLPALPTSGVLRQDRELVSAARSTLNERGLTLREAYALYLADPTHAWSRRTKVAHEATRTVVLSVLGGERPVDQITRADCRDLISVLQRIPRSASKRFPHLSPRDAADQMGPKCVAADRMSVANINAYLNKLGTFLNWAEMDEFISRNPLKGMRLLDTVKKKEKRHPFSAMQLQAIFDAPIYRGCQNDSTGYARRGDERPKGTRYWVPLLGLFTGMRLNEICQLEATDFVVIDRIPCLKVSAESPLGDGEKRLKTRSSERLVPVHNAVLDCGFGEFVAKRRRAEERNLFGDLPVDANGFRSTAFSKWFVRFLQQAKATADRTSFHSFRHCFRDALREAQIPRDIAHTLGGWTTGLNSQDVADVYGGGYSVGTLDAAIQKLTYKALDLSHLR